MTGQEFTGSRKEEGRSTIPQTAWHCSSAAVEVRLSAISSASISLSESGVVYFLLQVIVGAGDTLGPVIQAPDKTSLDVGRMVGPEVQVLVRVSGHSVDRDLQAAITLPPENCVQKQECSVLLDFHG